MEIKTVAGRSRGDFGAEVKGVKARLTAPVDDLRRWHAALEDFREKHGLRRPAYPDGSTLSTAVILIACVLVETLLNGYLFAQKNELGLLGGAMIAGLVSIVNVGISSVAGRA